MSTDPPLYPIPSKRVPIDSSWAEEKIKDYNFESASEKSGGGPKKAQTPSTTPPPPTLTDLNHTYNDG